ncbi:hypothetical protein [Flavobacterium sp.]|uniref:hypothetical protein n=1 Tax=Flavobacterium sp. TaxID=239 RepID=UPI00374CDA78
MQSQINLNTNWLLIKLSLILSFFPLLCFGNAGSSMMYFGLLHCAILNIFIGIAESIVLKKFKLSNHTWLIIIANYISAFIGLYFIAPYFSTITGNEGFWWGGKNDNLGYGLKGFFVGMAASFIATLIIEYPIFYLALKDRSKKNRLLGPFFIANFITNVIMTLVYYWIIVG